MNTQTQIRMVPLDRRAEVGDVNADTRTVELVFSTAKGGDVLRYDWDTGKRYYERLSLDPAHVRLDRLNNGAPLLNAHSAYTLANVIGVVEDGSVQLTKGDARAVVRFSKRDDVEPYYQDVRDKIIRNVSVGYRVHVMEPQRDAKDGIPVFLATDWEPYEISMVPMGADSGARVRASDEVPLNLCVIRRMKETEMDETTKTPETPAAPVAPPAPQPDAESIRAAAVAAERARVTGIQDACRMAKLDAADAASMIERGITLDAARAEVLTKLAERDAKATATEQRIVPFGEDTRDKWARGVGNWLIVKSGLAHLIARTTKTDESAIDPGEFRGFTLVDLARECLVRAGVSVRGLDKSAIVAKAFTLRSGSTQSTSDFTYALENTMHKVLQAAYAVTPDTWSKWCKRGTVSDFRAHYRYRMGSFGALDDLTENGEFKSKAITDAERASITASTVGNKIAVSRKMIINDDMGVFSSLLVGLGRAAALSVEVDAYALLAQNSGLGPTMADSYPVFDAAHNNISTAAAISAAAIDADAAKMARQTDKDGNEYLDLQPAVLLVERALKGTALTINDAQYDPDTANKLQKPNFVRGLFRDVVGTPRFASGATRRYLFADPSLYPVFEVAFMEGNEAPVLETKDGWDTDGAEMRVRFDYGVAAVDYRGAITNAGTA